MTIAKTARHLPLLLFTTAGACAYHCSNPPSMVGAVIVTP